MEGNDTSIERITSATEMMNKASKELDDFVHVMRSIDMKISGKIVERSAMLKKLEKFVDVLANFHGEYKKIVEDEKAAITEHVRREHEIASMVMSALGADAHHAPSLSTENGKSMDWAKAAAKVTVPSASTANVGIVPVNMPPSPAPSKAIITPVPIKATPTIDIMAYRVDKLDECHRFRGFWCYCPRLDTFCLSVNGQVLPAYLTDVLPAKDQPRKFDVHRGCHSGENIDPASTDFLIHSRYSPNSKDHRILTNRMQVIPASHNDNKARYSIRAGGRSSLHLDLPLLKMDDADLLADIAGHFLLVWQAVMSYMNKRYA